MVADALRLDEAQVGKSAMEFAAANKRWRAMEPAPGSGSVQHRQHAWARL